jgi:hypothetical protein
MEAEFEDVHTMQRIDAGISFLLLSASEHYQRERRYRQYRALEVEYVLSVDDRRPVREIPADAAYYLAAIHYGHAYDMVVEGAAQDMGAQLDATIGRLGGTLSGAAAKRRYHVHARGLGLRPRTPDAIFANDEASITRSYDVLGEAVPVTFELRSIPGRAPIDPGEDLAPPAIADEDVDLEEGQWKQYAVEQPGTYEYRVSTMNDGIQVKWGDGSCPRSGNYKEISGTCTIHAPTSFRVFNDPGTFGFGPTEHATVYLTKVADAPARAVASTTVASTTVAECDQYLALFERYMTCDKIPDQAKQASRQGIQQMEQAWAMLRDPSIAADAKQAAADACAQAVQALQQSASAMGCSLE